MSVNYSLAHMCSEPGNPDAPKKYYAKMQASGEVTLDEMAEDIAYATTLTDADVLAAIRAFIKQLNKHLANGKIVRAENLGSFQLQIQSTGADTEKDFTAANITGVSIQYRPGKFVSEATTKGLGGLTFRRVAKKGETLPDEPGGAGGNTPGEGEEGSFG